MVLCIQFVIKCYLCWRAHRWTTAGLAIIFCVLEPEMELVVKSKQHSICINRTLLIVLKALKAPCGGGSILFQACFSASGPPQLGTTEGRRISRRIYKVIYFVIVSVHHLQVQDRLLCLLSEIIRSHSMTNSRRKPWISTMLTHFFLYSCLLYSKASRV